MSNEAYIREYAINVRPLPKEGGGGFEALFPELTRSVTGYGVTQDEAVKDLMEAVPTFLELMEETGQSLPAPGIPKEWDDFSGKFNVRVPRILHAKLVRLAEDQGVSLNSIVQTILSAGATAIESGHEFGARQSTRLPDHAPNPEVRPGGKRRIPAAGITMKL